MSRRKNAPYEDALSPDERELVYEGHDIFKTDDGPDPKSVDQPRYRADGSRTPNGDFADWTDSVKAGNEKPAVFRVYEKLRPGIWSDRGLFLLRDYRLEASNSRKVFKFVLHQADFDTTGPRETDLSEAAHTRQIPTWVKQEVFKRDKGKCVICGANNQLHFDHDFPFSKGGASITPANVRILCTRHNLSKGARIE